LIVIVEKMLYERDTLPPGNSMLGRQWVEPAGCKELVLFVCATAGELYRFVLDVRDFGFGSTLLRPSTLRLHRKEGRADGLKTVFEYLGPRKIAGLYEVKLQRLWSLVSNLDKDGSGKAG
jgi:hypothetical protein